MEKKDKFSNLLIYAIIIIVAFSQGVLGLADLAINYLYKDDFKLKPSQVSLCLGITSIPWIIKPLWGVISDSYRLFGYRRKSYLILFGLIESFCWFLLSLDFIQQAKQGIIVLVTIQISVAFCNVIGEALLVEISRDQSKNDGEMIKSEEDKQEEASKNVSLFFGVRSLGVFLTAYTGGLLLEYINKRLIFRITAIFPLILSCVSFAMNEDSIYKQKENLNANDDDERIPLQKKRSEKAVHNENESTYKKVLLFVTKPEIIQPIVFIFVFMATPSSGSSMFYFYTNKLKFHPEFMGELKLIHAVANMLGIYIYNKFFKLVKFKKLFLWSSIICIFTGLSQILLVTRTNVLLGIPDKFFCIGDSLIIQTFAEINTIPLLVLACRLCPKNIEGTMYALLMSTLNFGSMISYQLGGILIYFLGITENEFGNLWLLIFFANLTTALPLPFIYWVNFDIASEIAEKQIETKNQKSNNNWLNKERMSALQNKSYLDIIPKKKEEKKIRRNSF